MEVWKDIKGYEGIYQVSNYGNVRSLDRVQIYCNGKKVKYKGKVLKQEPNSNGYLRVQFGNDRPFVHRLVASHFVQNPFPKEYIVVNHIDSNFLNNKANNLEWTTYAGNSIHAERVGRRVRTPEWQRKLRIAYEKNGRSVVGINIETGKEVLFKCLNDCKKEGFQPSCVCNCCKGVRQTHKGYKWRYA